MSAPVNPEAFPHVRPDGGGTSGMSLRDWFAGQALAGISAHPTGPHKMMGEGARQAHARWAYAAADAMLAERAKREGGSDV